MNGPKVQTYSEGLATVKSEFKKAVEDQLNNKEEEEEELFVKTTNDNDKEEYSKFLIENLQNEGVDPKKLTEWKNTKDDEEGFLLDFVLNRGWMEKGTAKPSINKPLSEESDIEELEKMEEFERAHNFRFEEENASEIVTHARTLPNVLRRPDTTRIDKRKEKKERKMIEKKQKKERLAHLKNVKMQEISERLNKIRVLAGAPVLKVEDLEGEFDPDSYDSKMKEEFGDGYYSSKNIQKPVFDDEIDITDLGMSDEQPLKDLEQPSKKPKKKKKKNKEAVADCEDPDFNMDCEAIENIQNNNKVRTISQNTDLMEELYPLEYEDMVKINYTNLCRLEIFLQDSNTDQCQRSRLI